MTYSTARAMLHQSGDTRAAAKLTMSFGACLLAGSALVLPTAAHAQETQGNEAADANVSNVGDIVVTARQIVEALTEVPAAVTSYSADFIQKQNIQSFADYATKVPNLSFQYGQSGESFWGDSRETSIRGVVGNDTTAYYIDDTPVPGSVSPQVLNLERIEVLKGPQGTLFGASSMGGNLRYISKKPSLTENEGQVRVQGGGTWNAGFDYDVNVQNNFVLVPDRLAVNAAIGYMQESGFIKRRFPNAAGDLVTVGGQGRNRTLSASVAVRAQFTDEFSVTFSALGQRTRLRGHPGAFLPIDTYRPTTYTIDRENDVEEYSEDDWAIGSAVLNYKGDGFNVVSSTSFFARRLAQLDDNSEATNYFFNESLGIPLGDPVFVYNSEGKNRRLTQETRLSFDDGTILPGLSGIVGIFHQDSRSPGTNPGIFVQALADAGFEPAYLADTPTTSTFKNTAVFGELYYEMVPRLTFTLGLRQYWLQQKQLATTQTGLLFGPEGLTTPTISNKESGLIPKAVISYEIGDRGNIYASAAKGFRPGSPAVPLGDFCEASLEELGLPRDGSGYKSDTLWSYEVGAKSRFAGGRANASVAAFRMDWTDIQQTITLGQPCGLPVTVNAGKARINGGEIEVGGQPFADIPLTLQLGIGYTDAKLIDPGLSSQEANTRLTYIPKWTASISGYYETPISSSVDFFVAADYSYTSSSPVPKPLSSSGEAGFTSRPPINLVNANFGFTFGQSKLMFFVKNLFDKRLTYGSQGALGFERYARDPNTGVYGDLLPRGAVSRPRQIGVQYQITF